MLLSAAILATAKVQVFPIRFPSSPPLNPGNVDGLAEGHQMLPHHG